MCMLAVVMWVCIMVKELQAIWTYTTAVRALVSAGGTGRTTLTRDKDGLIRIEQISTTRFWCCAIVQTIRLVVCLLFLWYGSLFLIYTPSVTELMLNAVALEFLISIDELLFETLAPIKVKYVFAHVHDLSVPPSRTWNGVDCRTSCFTAFAAIVVMLFFFCAVAPQREVLVKARDALCAGDQEFVFVRDKLGAVAWTYPDDTNTEQLNKRNFPDGSSPSQGNEAVTVRSGSFSESVIDVLLRQQGRHAFQANCGTKQCYINDTKLGGLIARPGRPDCCHAKRAKVPQTVAGRWVLIVCTTS